MTTFVSSYALAVALPGMPSPGFGAHQEAPSSAAHRSLRHASASTESLPTSSPAVHGPLIRVAKLLVCP